VTDIEWTDETWNPTDGCKVCSPGCANCYAMRFAGRFSKPGERYHGLVTIGKNKRATWSGEGRIDSGKLAKPLHWRKPRRIFVNSMSDLFYEEFSNEQIASVYGVMAACPQHTFQVLTKRAARLPEWYRWLEEVEERAAVEWSGRDCATDIHDARLQCILEHLDEAACDAIAGTHDVCHLGLTTNKELRWPLRNVWPGVSVEDRKHGVPRIDELRRVPAAVRMLSCEPLLEDLGVLDLTGIGWVIAGCETGLGARPCHVEWLRSLRDQCQAAGVPFFLKQAEESADCGEDRLLDIGDDDSIAFGEGSKMKRRRPGGNHILGLPYLDGVQHAEFPTITTAFF
jgi:protein gp37